MSPQDLYHLQCALHGLRKPSFEATAVVGKVFCDQESNALVIADEIFHQLENSSYRISRATVYRTFRNLHRVGMIEIVDGEASTSFRYRKKRLVRGQ